jgi:hypothetical protein
LSAVDREPTAAERLLQWARRYIQEDGARQRALVDGQSLQVEAASENAFRLRITIDLVDAEGSFR